MDLISVTMMVLSTAIREIRVSFLWALFSILMTWSWGIGAISFRDREATSVHTSRVDWAPGWQVDIRALGYQAPQGPVEEFGIDLGIDPISFLADQQVVVTFVTEEFSGRVEHRDSTSTGDSEAYRIHAIFINATNGHVVNTLEWSSSSVRARVLSVSSEKFAVLTPGRLLLYSSDFRFIKRLDLPLAQESANDTWSASVSPAGRFLLLTYEPALENKQFLDQTHEVEIRCEWIDLENLVLVQHWSTAIDGSHPQFISDEGIVEIENRSDGKDGDSTNRKVLSIGTAPNGPWRIVCSSLASSYCSMGPFVNNTALFTTRFLGHSTEDRRLWLGVVDTSGRLLFQDILPKKDMLRGPIERSSDGQRFAVAFLNGKGGNVFFDVGPHYTADRIMIFDMASRRWIYELDAKKQKVVSISGMALSADGTQLGLIDQNGILNVYSIPHTPS